MTALASLPRIRTVILAFCLAVSGTSLAAETAAVPLFEVTRLLGADDCPDGLELAAAVGRRLASAPPDASPERIAAARFEVMFSHDRSDYVAILRNDAIGAERTIVGPGPTCAALAGAVAVSTTVLLDRLGKGDAVSSSPPPVPKRRRATTPREDLPVAPADPPDSSPDDTTERPAGRVVFFEIMGSGIGESINYEHFLDNGVASVRLGIGYTKAMAAGFSGEQWTLPALLQLESSATGSHNFHFATGVTLVYRKGKIEDAWYNPLNSGLPEGFEGMALNALANVVIGYRYLPRRPGFTFGLVAMGLFNWS